MDYEYLLEDGETMIDYIIQNNINKLEQDIKELEEEYNSCKLNIKMEGVHSLIYNRLNWHRATLYSQIIDKLKNEITTYKNSFSRELIDGIEYELQHGKVIDNLEYKHEGLMLLHLSHIYKSIVIARVDILYFQKSSLGENDYSKDTVAIDKKIKDVQEFTFVDTNFKYPELPHVIIQKLIFTLCDEKKSQFSSVPFQPVDKKVIKLIGKLLSGKERAPKEQKNLTAKEREKFRLRERFKHL